MARRAGRPPTDTPAGQKVTLSIRTTAVMKSRLAAAADSEGRNLSEEAERRLEGSFRDERLLDAALGMADDPVNAGLMLLVGQIFNAASQIAYLHGFSHWLDDPFTSDLVARLMRDLIEGRRSEGDDPSIGSAGANTEAWNRLLWAPVDRVLSSGGRSEPIGDRLGPYLDRLPRRPEPKPAPVESTPLGRLRETAPNTWEVTYLDDGKPAVVTVQGTRVAAEEALRRLVGRPDLVWPAPRRDGLK